MIELQGRYNNAKVFTDNVEATAVSQIINLLNQPFVKDSKIRIMPDTHAGAGCVIGFTAQMGDMVIPNLVGVDIGCGMEVVELGDVDIDLDEFDKIVHTKVPAGFTVHQQAIVSYPEITDLTCFGELYDSGKFERAIGTLGGGNHFIELNIDDENNKYLVIHSGSRNLGKQVADIHQKKAIEVCAGKYPKDLCFLEGELLKNYLTDMNICQAYASENRFTIAEEILQELFNAGVRRFLSFETIHNYVDFETGIIRKGAVSAMNGERLIIPINMRDGSIIATGKGNEDWNFSAPHGAGRLMGRGEAKRRLSMQDFTDSMEGIYSSTVNQSTLDEAPMAYKPMQEILDNIKETVTIDKIIKPIYNFKSSGE